MSNDSGCKCALHNIRVTLDCMKEDLDHNNIEWFDFYIDTMREELKTIERYFNNEEK